MTGSPSLKGMAVISPITCEEMFTVVLAVMRPSAVTVGETSPLTTFITSTSKPLGPDLRAVSTMTSTRTAPIPMMIQRRFFDMRCP